MVIIFSRNKNKEKSIRTRLFTIPVVVVTISMLAIIYSVSSKTDATMRAEMQQETEFLLENVVSRLGDGVGPDNEIDADRYQLVIEDLGRNEEVAYAGFIDREYGYVANTNRDFIGKDMSQDSHVKQVSMSKEPSTGERVEVVGTEEEKVLDTIYPVVVNGELLGVLKIGFTLDDVNAGIRANVVTVVIAGLIALFVLSLVLYRASREIVYILNSLRGDTELMAEGDFTMEVPEEMQDRQDEFGRIARANVRMKNSVREMIADISSKAEGVAAYAEELAATVQDSERSADELSSVIGEIANATTSQADDVETGLNSIYELEASMEVNDENLEKLNQSNNQVNTLKDEGLELIRDLVDKTEETRKSVDEISEVIGSTNVSADNIVKAIEMIRSIADETNLLALNATIEAARAGEHGRGFSVVANEIRALAEESEKFTEEIEEIVNDLLNKTNMAVETMDNVEEIVDSQSNSVSRTDDKFEGIALSIEDIDTVREAINRSNREIEEQEKLLSGMIENLAAVAQENAAGTQESLASVEEQGTAMAQLTEASGELASIAEELNEASERFTV